MKRLKRNPDLDFLILDYQTIFNCYSKDEIKLYLSLEPYSNDTLTSMYLLMLDFQEVEMYEYCAIIKKEIDKRTSV